MKSTSWVSRRPGSRISVISWASMPMSNHYFRTTGIWHTMAWYWNYDHFLQLINNSYTRAGPCGVKLLAGFSVYYNTQNVCMRKIAIIFSVVLLSSTRILAQTSVELIPQVGYSFADRTDFYNTYGRIEGGLNLGGAINFNINRNVGIEVLYNHTSGNSGVWYYGYDGGNQINGGHLSQDFI